MTPGTNKPEIIINEPTFFILLSLASGPKHGYAVLKDTEELSQGKVNLSTSTLYTALNRLLNQGFIERSDAGQNGSGPGLPRKVYRLNERGRRILNAEAMRMQVMLASYQQRLGEEHA
ncbi:MAG: PadR family transcriptional regulator [Chloroflexi bacterium]|nr:PadR family transcriptional regulator [Chloroflexota bacterium]